MVILPLTTILPLKVEPLTIEVTKNPLFGDTEAVTEPDFISVDINASCDNAERGISNKPAPLPLYDEPELSSIPPLTNKEPVKREPL